MANEEDLEADALVMRRVASGDAAAYRGLVDAHLKSILAYGQRFLGSLPEAEEVAQETFLRAWQHADEYRPEARISTWLHAIAHNLCIDRLRRRRVVPVGDAMDEMPDSDRRPSELLEQKQSVLGVQQALETLPDRQRAALTLIHYQGMSHAQAGEVLGIGVEAVESLVMRARRNLKQALIARREKEPESR